jgi:hypothetical protein
VTTIDRSGFGFMRATLVHCTVMVVRKGPPIVPNWSVGLVVEKGAWTLSNRADARCKLACSASSVFGRPALCSFN